MHVLMIPSWYPVDTDCVSGIFFREQALAIAEKNIKVGLIYPHLYSLKKMAAANKPNIGLCIYDDSRVKTYIFYDWNWSYKLSSFRHKHWLKLGYELFEIYVKDHGIPDLIHVQSALLGGLLALKIYRKFNIPFIVTEHSSKFGLNTLSSSDMRACKNIFLASSKNIVVSPSLGHTLENRLSPCRFSWEWVPNFLDKRFENQQYDGKQEGLINNYRPDEDFTFLNLAIATKNKAQVNLVRAFSKAFKGEEKVKLKIGGDGPALKEVNRVIYQENLQEQVHCLGSLNRSRVLDEMKSTEAFVLSSHYETFGVVLIEALACGKPVIATRCGGPECIVEKGDGLLVENRNIEALSSALISLKVNLNDYNADDIRSRCIRRFGASSVIEKITEIYSGIIQG